MTVDNTGTCASLTPSRQGQVRCKCGRWTAVNCQRSVVKRYNMKYSLTIQDKSYVVEIEDINARPVIAYVEGIRFEVIPDTDPVGSEVKSELKKEAQRDRSYELRKSASSQN